MGKHKTIITFVFDGSRSVFEPNCSKKEAVDHIEWCIENKKYYTCECPSKVCIVNINRVRFIEIEEIE